MSECGKTPTNPLGYPMSKYATKEHRELAIAQDRIAQLERELAEAVSKVDVAEVLRDHLLGRELSLEDAFKRRLGIDLMYHLKKQKGADE